MAEVVKVVRFNTQPPEGGWALEVRMTAIDGLVSTHSRPKAAGSPVSLVRATLNVSTHSRPKAAGG